MSRKMPPRSPARALRWIACLLSLLAAATAAPCGEPEVKAPEDLLKPVPGADPWYATMRSYLAWPTEKQRKELPAVEAVPDAEYSVEAFLGEILRPGVLDKKWPDAAIRAPGWVKLGDEQAKRDAYLIRSSYKDGLLQICDTRGVTVVAYVPAKPLKIVGQDLPKLLRDYAAELFTFTFPEKMSVERDKATQLIKARATFNIPLPDAVPKERIAALAGEHRGDAMFYVSCSVREDIGVFTFHKGSVRNCAADARYPLFRIPGSKSLYDEVQEYMRSLKDEADPKRIPELFEWLDRIAKKGDLSEQQIMRNPYVAKQAGTAHDAVAIKLQDCIGQISGKEAGDLKLLASLPACIEKRAASLPRGRTQTLKETLGDALRRIGTEETAVLYRRMIDSEADASVRQYLLKEVGKVGDAAAAREWSWKKLEAVAVDPDKSPSDTIAYLQYLPPRPSDPALIEVLCRIQTKSPRQDVLRADAKALALLACRLGTAWEGCDGRSREALRSGDDYTQFAAIVTVSELGQPALIPELVELLSKASDARKKDVFRALGALCGSPATTVRTGSQPPKAHAEAEAALKEVAARIGDGPKVAGGAVPTAVEVGKEAGLSADRKMAMNSAAVQKLDELSANPDEKSRETLRLLEALPGEPIIEYLRLVGAVCEKTKDPSVRTAAIRMAGSGSTLRVRRALAEGLRAGCKSEDAATRAAACAGLACVGNGQSVAVLAGLLTDPDGKVRLVAARGLCHMLGWPAPAPGKEEAAWLELVSAQAAKVVEALKSPELVSLEELR